MKTAEEIFKRFKIDDFPYYEGVSQGMFNQAITERDTEWKQKIQTALDKTSNWNCKEVLTKLLEDK